MDESPDHAETFDEMLDRWDRQAGHSAETLAEADAWARQRVADINADWAVRRGGAQPADNASGDVVRRSGRRRVFEIRAPRDLGLAVAEARAILGRSQTDVAEDNGLPRAALSKIETATDESVILQRAIRVLRRLGCTISVQLPPPGS